MPPAAATALEGPFTFVEPEVDGPTVLLRYRIGDDLDLSERIVLPAPVPDTDAARRAVRVLHLAAGVSYYKCAVPTTLRTPPLLPAERDLVVALYDEGLREMAHRTGIGVPVPVVVEEAAGDAGPTAPPTGAPTGAPLIPVGGGKDSVLVADLVPHGRLLTVNPVGAHEHLAAALGRPLLRVERTLDPRLRELVAQGAPNGHVPVTAIVSAIAVLAAVALGSGEVLMGIERSADEPTVVVDGVAVNHQFSKSGAAEELLGAAFAPTGVRYFSLLRPLTELAIGAAVAGRGLSPHIVSCNRVFTVWDETTASRTQRPCGDCAKCLFTALMLAPGSTPAAVAEQYGRPLLDEEAHIAPVRELWSDAKPFDCVGERVESAAAVALLGRSPEWREQAVVAALAGEAQALLDATGTTVAELLRPGPVEGLPAPYRPVLDTLRDDLAAAAGADARGAAPGGAGRAAGGG